MDVLLIVFVSKLVGCVRQQQSGKRNEKTGRPNMIMKQKRTVDRIYENAQNRALC